MKYPDPNKMMSPQEFAVAKRETPYVFEIITADGRALFYYGARHSQDITDPMFKDIRDRFEKFQPDIVFIEGVESLNYIKERDCAIRTLSEETDQETILRHGEVGFTLRLALEQRIDVESPEAPYKDKIEYCISKGFSREAAFVYFVVQYIQQLQRYPGNVPRPILEEYAAEELKTLKRITGWNDFDFSLENFYKLFKRVAGKDFSIDDPSLEDILDPMPWSSLRDKQTVVNDISRAETRCRDEYMLMRIAEALTNHRRLFIVYGSGHAITQEPALRSYLSEQYDRTGVDTMG